MDGLENLNQRFPIYWVPQRVGSFHCELNVILLLVSNLLGSPASGETKDVGENLSAFGSFQFIGFPSEWGAFCQALCPLKQRWFPIYWVPQRVGR